MPLLSVQFPKRSAKWAMKCTVSREKRSMHLYMYHNKLKDDSDF